MLSCSVHGMIVTMASLRWMILLVLVVGFVGRECQGNDLLLSPPSAMLCGGCETCQNPCASAPPPPVLPPPPPVLPPPPPPPACPPPPPPACPPPPLALPPPPPASDCDCPPTAGNGDGSPPAPYRYIFGGQPGSPGSNPYYDYYNHASRPPVFLRFNLLISILPLLYWVLLNFLP